MTQAQADLTVMTSLERTMPILCVDFDGVIHSYTSPWVAEHIIPDPPVPGALEWLWKATEWFTVTIYSSRSKTHLGRTAMFQWLLKHSRELWTDSTHPMCTIDMKAHPIRFAAEKPAAFLTIDDRCIEFDGDWSQLDPADMLSFKPWNKRTPVPPVEPYKP